MVDVLQSLADGIQVEFAQVPVQVLLVLPRSTRYHIPVVSLAVLFVCLICALFPLFHFGCIIIVRPTGLQIKPISRLPKFSSPYSFSSYSKQSFNDMDCLLSALTIRPTMNSIIDI